MGLKLNNKYLKVGGRLLSVVGDKSPEIAFNVRGTLFPGDSYPGQTNVSFNSLEFYSSSPNKLFIDWADGTTDTYDFVLTAPNVYRVRFYRNTRLTPPTSGATNYDRPLHYYQDLGALTGTVNDTLEIRRKIVFTFKDHRSIYLIASFSVPYFDSFPAEIGRLTNLNLLNIQGSRYITYFPSSLYRTKIKDLSLITLGNAINDQIPLWILNSSLDNLTLSGTVNLSNPETSNFSKINLLKNTLKSLVVAGSTITNLPDELAECKQLKNLDLNSNRFTSPPSVINQMPWIDSISLLGGHSGVTYLNSWGDMSNLVNLSTLRISISLTPMGVIFPSTVPGYVFSNWVKLKVVNIESVFWQSQSRCDDVVTNWYNGVVSAASITGSATLPFRGMTFTFYSAREQFLPYNLRPSGTFQKPAGYVQSVSNGSPASPLEMIWVLTNQYGHTWTIKP